jgi:Golgi SNAP receptor complex protein 2
MGSVLMLGGITTTLGALSRLIDDYDSMAKKEMVTAAREKANMWVSEWVILSALWVLASTWTSAWKSYKKYKLIDRRVARLKTEHRELKARFDRAKAESQIKVFSYFFQYRTRLNDRTAPTY